MTEEDFNDPNQTIESFAYLLNRRAARGWYSGRSSALLKACSDGRMNRWAKDPSTKITVDGTKGIWFQVGPLQAHLPYDLIPKNESTLGAMRTVLGNAEYAQLSEKLDGAAADTHALDENLECQLLEAGFQKKNADALSTIVESILVDPALVAEILAKGVHISEKALSHALLEHSSTLSLPQRAERLLQLAQGVARSTADIPDAVHDVPFDSIEGHLNDIEYSNSVPKILDAVFQKDVLASLKNEGVLVTRGTYRKGAEGVLFWGKGVVSQHFILPAKHVRKDSEAYSSTELVDRQEFQAVVRFQQTQRQFINASRAVETIVRELLSQNKLEDSLQSSELSKALHDIEVIVGSECPDKYMAFHTLISPLKRLHGVDLPNERVAEELLTQVSAIRVDYARAMEVASTKELLDRRYPEIQRAYIELGSDFLSAMPPQFVAERDDRGNPTRYDADIMGLLNENPVVVAVAHARDKDLPLAKVLTAMNTIGIKPDKPLISIETGSAFLTDPDELRATELAARTVVQFAEERGANVAISDTQSGGGGKVGKEVLLAQARAKAEGREPRFHPYAIAAAKETYIPLPEAFYQQYEEGPDGKPKLVDMYACNPVAMYLTNQPADWLGADKDTLYLKLSMRERSMHAAVSGGYREGQTPIMKGLTVVMNGGPRVVMKANIDAELGGHLVLVKGTGRFADLGAAIFDAAMKADVNEWKDLTYGEIIARVKALIPSLPAYTQPQITRDLDVSRGTLGCEQVVQFVRHLSRTNVFVTTADNLYQTLTEQSQS